MALRPHPAARPAIHVLIVDQRLAFRDALATRLQTEPDLAVVAKAHSAKFAPRVLVGRSADVILLDADLPDDSAIAFCSELTQRGDPSRVVMVSAASQPERIVAAVRAGAAAWVRKDESVDHLLRVIRGVVRGDTWIPPRELGVVLRLLIEDQDRRRDGDDLLASLTPRERDVLFLLVEGAGRKEVAERLQLSANTVRTHLHSLMVEVRSPLHARSGGTRATQAGGTAAERRVALVRPANGSLTPLPWVLVIPIWRSCSSSCGGAVRLVICEAAESGCADRNPGRGG